MFERALIRRIDGTDVDLGLIAETIFFYGKTHLLLDQPFLIGLSRALSLSDFQRLIKSETVHLSYKTGNFGVVSTAPPKRHKFVEFFVGTENKKKFSVPEDIEFFLSRELKDARDAEAIKRLIIRNVKTHRSPRDQVPKLTDADVGDSTYLVSGIKAILQNLIPEFVVPANLEFSLHNTGDGYVVVTNLDYIKINQIYHLRVAPEHSTISSEYLLSFLQEARADTYLAAHYLSEIVTTPTLSDLIRLKHFEFLVRRDASSKELELFNEIALGDFPSIREVINNGERTFAEFLDLIESAHKFRAWIEGQNPDANLLREYQRAATANTWANKLPTKGLRFAIATGIGLLGEAFVPVGLSTAVGVAAGAGDSFLLDKMIKGWRPNQFIENRMTSFLDPGNLHRKQS